MESDKKKSVILKQDKQPKPIETAHEPTATTKHTNIKDANDLLHRQFPGVSVHPTSDGKGLHLYGQGAGEAAHMLLKEGWGLHHGNDGSMVVRPPGEEIPKHARWKNTHHPHAQTPKEPQEQDSGQKEKKPAKIVGKEDKKMAKSLILRSTGLEKSEIPMHSERKLKNELTKSLWGYRGQDVDGWAGQFYGAQALRVQALQCIKDQIECRRKREAFDAKGKDWDEVQELPKSKREAYREQRRKEREPLEKENEAIIARMRVLEEKLIDYKLTEAKAMQDVSKSEKTIRERGEALMKAQGEGSRGGKVIGHTVGGKAIYEHHKAAEYHGDKGRVLSTLGGMDNTTHPHLKHGKAWEHAGKLHSEASNLHGRVHARSASSTGDGSSRTQVVKASAIQKTKEAHEAEKHALSVTPDTLKPGYKAKQKQLEGNKAARTYEERMAEMKQAARKMKASKEMKAKRKKQPMEKSMSDKPKNDPQPVPTADPNELMKSYQDGYSREFGLLPFSLKPVKHGEDLSKAMDEVGPAAIVTPGSVSDEFLPAYLGAAGSATNPGHGTVHTEGVDPVIEYWKGRALPPGMAPGLPRFAYNEPEVQVNENLAQAVDPFQKQYVTKKK